MDVSLAGFQSATDLVKQLITLATGSLALSITFAKDIVKTNVPVVTWPLKIAWIAWLLSICFGIWTMMAVTGMLFKIAENADASKTYAANVSIPAFLQILMFLLGIALLILHGAKMLRIKTD